jgi:hypothetical protein
MGLASVNVLNSMGANGCVYVNGTTAVNGSFIAVQFTEPSVIGAITAVMDNSADLIADATSFGTGQVIYVPFTSITLTSGAAILYKGSV